MRGERGEILTQALTVDVHSVVWLKRASVESLASGTDDSDQHKIITISRYLSIFLSPTCLKIVTKSIFSSLKLQVPDRDQMNNE